MDNIYLIESELVLGKCTVASLCGERSLLITEQL